jgi:hypothetical protein
VATIGDQVPSLVGTTIRRTVIIGWRYLGIGIAFSLLLSIVLILAGGGRAFPTAYPLELPLFASLGSTAGLMTFTSDRTKGVFEYLIAYGVRPRTLFANGLISTAAMTTVILSSSLAVGLGLGVARGLSLTPNLLMAIAFYSVPMSFAASLFVAIVGMIWASISSPRTGMNSPVGIAPMVGVAPIILVLLVAETSPASEYYYITTGAAVAIILVVAGLLSASARLMGRERFLSPL